MAKVAPKAELGKLHLWDFIQNLLDLRLRTGLWGPQISIGAKHSAIFLLEAVKTPSSITHHTHVTHHTAQITHHTSHITLTLPHTSHITHRTLYTTSHATRTTSHRKSHITRGLMDKTSVFNPDGPGSIPTSPLMAHHPSHITHHTSHHTITTSQHHTSRLLRDT